jgi:hypothetical protein
VPGNPCGPLAWLPEAVFLGLRVEECAAGRAFLADLLPLVTSTAADHGTRALDVALSHGGLDRLRLPQAALDQFSLELAGGMSTATRSALLGDEGEHAPSTRVGRPRRPPRRRPAPPRGTSCSRR